MSNIVKVSNVRLRRLQRRFVTVDVFTERAYRGNPLAVVLDTDGLTAQEMQQIAREFNYSETTFVFPARESSHTAHVRIFTPRIEVPFAGHPNIGTAVVLADELDAGLSSFVEPIIFEEAAGLVAIHFLRAGRRVIGAELATPEALSVLRTVSDADAAACISLLPLEVSVITHPPHVLSVGLPWLVVEVTTRDALRRSSPDLAAHQRVLPPLGIDGVMAYYHVPGTCELHSRVYAPLDGTIEDPATGSAAAAAIALRAFLRPEPNLELTWHIEQGADLGRPSSLFGRTIKASGRLASIYIGGHAVIVMRGTLNRLP